MIEPWQIPKGWAWAGASEIAEIVGGGTPRTDDPTNFEGGDVPWITPADLSGYKDKHISRGARNITRRGLENSGARLMPEGTVLFSSRAPIGYVAIAANPVSTNQGFKSFILTSGITPDYAYYYLQRAKDLAIELSSGTTFREISGAKAAMIPFPVAPAAEQTRIVEEIEKQLTRLDAAVSALQRVQANLKRYRASVLKAACEGRLVPTEAELARREGRSYEPASALLHRLAVERMTKSNSKLDERGHPPRLPEGWIWTSLSSACSKIQDGTHFSPKVQHLNGKYKYITAKNIKEWGLDLSELTYLDEAVHKDIYRRCNPEPGDVLYIKDGVTTGLAAINTLKEEFSLLSSVALLKPIRGLLEAGYLKHYLNSPDGFQRMTARMTGTAIKRLILERIRESLIALPPQLEQARIVESADRHLSLIDAATLQLTTNFKRLNRLRQSILKAAFEGKLVPQDPNDEPASALLERIRGTATHGSVSLPGKRIKRSRRAIASKETANV